MKTSLLIVLMLGFLIGNAQQSSYQTWLKGAGKTDLIYSGINPGYQSDVELYKHEIRKTDSHPGYPFECCPYQDEIRIIDFDDPGYTFESYPYLNKDRRTDNNAGYPSKKNQYQDKMAKTD